MKLRDASKQWLGLLAGLSTRQRLSLAIVTTLVLGSLLGFVWWKRQQDYKPLFTKMTPEDAAAIVEKLKESGIEYRVENDGGSVLVRTAQVADTRLQLAAAGLPKTGRIGFELFDKTNLGSTDFAEQINYHRALEGELERTIRSVAAVEQVRVHLTFPKDSVFLESRLPAKGSVLLRIRPGASITSQNISAIRHLVANAVEGLAADAVSVMDVEGNLLGKPRNTQERGESSDEFIEYRQTIERDLLQKINSTLLPLLGEGRYRAGVSVECDFTSGEQSEEVYDPDKSVMTNSTKTEDTNSSGGAGGVPGTSSNLPRSTPRSASAGVTVSRRSETIAYQTSKTVKRLHLPRGGIKRLSASVLLDQTVRWDGQGSKAQRVLVPPSPESVRAIREIVAAAIGFSQTRGDQLVIESLPFGSTLQAPPPAATPEPVAPSPVSNEWLTQLTERRLEAIGLVVLVILCSFLMLRKRRKRIAKQIEMAKALPQGGAGARIEADKHHDEALDSASTRLLEGNNTEAITRSARIETLISTLRESVAEDPVLASSVLRNWLEEPKK